MTGIPSIIRCIYDYNTDTGIDFNSNVIDFQARSPEASVLISQF